ncbi:PREDICTED: LOW QUALITY PROTEIN: calvin cycle protein CP12-3, chloroplastic-like [Camelina sativa]|uniref:LOW QUALITY PROTEIN: calvin cycle protein CP12-3, chloroplastic-like n=1 Tax=Camelina sativa TaxID=90675 RepID=A0ABM0X2F0_CAMSA|nr:PREDICTED: LOW QUALITY PROTEIN: calvin cycle protein CP12-3, chloroplastic-like [Camelina sativa]
MMMMSAAASHVRVLLPLHQQGRSISTGSGIIRLIQTEPRRFKLTMATTATAKYKGTKMREEKLSEMIEEKVKEATEVCDADERSEECRVAWDEVEEVSQARSDLRIKLKLLNQDPLESVYQDNPETDECRVYED